MSSVRYLKEVGAINFVSRTACLQDANGATIFRKENVIFPDFYSQVAVDVITSKYFEPSAYDLRDVVSRVVRTLASWVDKRTGYSQDQVIEELSALLLLQYMSFNSPVWFNVGLIDKPQCSACFILGIEDSLDSILKTAYTEAMIFKHGSGAGINLSALRSSGESLSNGGFASGPVSFMRGFDAFAGAIKSGGKTRRAARMVVLDIDHPDIEEFITCKVKEERRMRTLVEAGYDGSLDGELYAHSFYQNANHSVRIPDTFMHAVQNDAMWPLISVTTRNVIREVNARRLFRMIAEAAHECGDPGIQFATTINDWHTCSRTDSIYASNPCAEFLFLNNSSCNLASLNLLKFMDADEFDVDCFTRVVRLVITVQDAIVDNASYPTEAITETTKRFRPLGLGFSNVGALLMSQAIPYASDKARAYVAAIAAIMTGAAYEQSAKLAKSLGPFDGYSENEQQMLRVIRKHLFALNDIAWDLLPSKFKDVAFSLWNNAFKLGKEYGYRNAQVTAIAPTGTISLAMDCATTGIEPEISLVKQKLLVGGGTFELSSHVVVEKALHKLGYSSDEISDIMKHISSTGAITSAPHLKQEHLPVFACSLSQPTLSPYDHLRMVASVQPFISGGVSKTINMPENVTVDEVCDLFMKAWTWKVKVICVYRDGSKTVQPIVTKKKSVTRRRLPDERQSITHKFDVAGYEGYITAGMFDDRSLGEIFITIAKEGSTISGLMDGFATVVSIALQYGVPLEVLASKFIGTRFEPSGFTKNSAIPIATSLLDYIFRWLVNKFGNGTVSVSAPEVPCPDCGKLMTRAGTCMVCPSCGATTGCG